MSTRAAGSSARAPAAKSAAADHSWGGWGCPKSNIGAWTTRDGPSRARSTARSWEIQVCAMDRQLTMCVMPFSVSAGSVAAVGRLPTAMRWSPIQLSAAFCGLGP